MSSIGHLAYEPLKKSLENKHSGWTFFWMGAVILVFSAIIFGGYTWAENKLEATRWEASEPWINQAPSWQRRGRNFSRQYDINLIEEALKDFKTKHAGRLPNFEDITVTEIDYDDREYSVWHYSAIQHIDDHNLYSYNYKSSEFIEGSVGYIPTDDKSFYGALPSVPSQARLPDSRNIHIWLNYACNDGAYERYSDVIRQSTSSDFAIVYSLEDPEELGDSPPEQLIRCQGEDDL